MARLQTYFRIASGPLLFSCALLACSSQKKSGGGDAGGLSMGNGGEYDYEDIKGGAWDTSMSADEEPSADTGYYPPEIEVTSNYLVPKGAGRYVFIPDEARDAVVIVDSETLLIEVVEVGSRPTHIVSLEDPDQTIVATINLNSDDVTVIRMDEDGDVETASLPVRPDTNALAPSPDGRYIIAYHDPLFTYQSGSPNTDQEISILDVTPGEEASYERTVGMHPWKVIYDEAVERAFVVTEGGINIVDLTALETDERSEPIALFEHGSYDSATADIEIAPDGSVAVGRKANTAELKVAGLKGDEPVRTYTLPAVSTDLDISKDGAFGVLVFRTLGTVGFFDLPLPEDPETDPFSYAEVGDRIVGVATLSADGNRILLHTTTGGEDIDRRRLTLMDRTEEGWDIDSAVLERQIESVITVESTNGECQTAVVMHKEISPGAGEMAHAYSLVTVPSLMSKLQQIAVPPGQLLFTPSGDFGFLLLETAYSVEQMNLETLIVNDIELSSQPFAAGYADETDNVFIAQDHPAGRMTFLGVYDESVRTVTGFNLNEEIEISK